MEPHRRQEEHEGSGRQESEAPDSPTRDEQHLITATTGMSGITLYATTGPQMQNPFDAYRRTNLPSWRGELFSESSGHQPREDNSGPRPRHRPLGMTNDEIAEKSDELTARRIAERSGLSQDNYIIGGEPSFPARLPSAHGHVAGPPTSFPTNVQDSMTAQAPIPARDSRISGLENRQDDGTIETQHGHKRRRSTSKVEERKQGHRPYTNQMSAEEIRQELTASKSEWTKSQRVDFAKKYPGLDERQQLIRVRKQETNKRFNIKRKEKRQAEAAAKANAPRDGQEAVVRTDASQEAQHQPTAELGQTRRRAESESEDESLALIRQRTEGQRSHFAAGEMGEPSRRAVPVLRGAAQALVETTQILSRRASFSPPAFYSPPEGVPVAHMRRAPVAQTGIAPVAQMRRVPVAQTGIAPVAQMGRAPYFPMREAPYSPTGEALDRSSYSSIGTPYLPTGRASFPLAGGAPYPPIEAPLPPIAGAHPPIAEAHQSTGGAPYLPTEGAHSPLGESGDSAEGQFASEQEGRDGRE